MGSGHVCHAWKDRVHVLRYFGCAEYPLAPSIKRFMDELLTHGPIRVVFDLTNADSLDSTNLGLLARMAERIQEAGGGRSLIVSTKEDINCVLHSMGFDKIFDLVTEPDGEPSDLGETLSSGLVSREELRQAMLTAHQTLSGLSDTSSEEFREVIACLEADAAQSVQAKGRNKRGLS